MAQIALTALSWSCLLYGVGSERNEAAVKVEINKIVETQAFLLTAVVSADNGKVLDRAYSLVFSSL